MPYVCIVPYLGYETSPTTGSLSVEGANVTENFLHEPLLRGQGKWVLKTKIEFQLLKMTTYYRATRQDVAQEMEIN